MSMISEQIKELELFRDSYFYDNSTGSKIINAAIATIKELSAKVASENMERSSRYYNGGWIPCSERMPKPLKNVLVSTANGEVYVSYLQASIYNSYIKWENFANGGGKIIAWMPLPKPFKKEADNGND